MEDIEYKLNEESQKGMENNSQESNNENESYTVRDVKIEHGHNIPEENTDGSEMPTAPSAEVTEYSLPDDFDIQTWDPPEPENSQDDVDNSVACDDDDEYEGIGIANLDEPTSISCSKNEVSGSYRFKEEKQRAIEEVMNGKFRAIVGQLLKSVGVSSSDEGDKSWVDVVTSLSWRAASFLKLDAIGVNAMNPDGYVKVKCIAVGSRSQSQLIKGLVFKKHAAHKHMPTKYKNPRLLLISGVLGISGLSSFDSMDQEKDYLRSKMDLIEMCHPNVILVEKTVSRDIQESILAKGMTLVLDMKLHRLGRVALCTGSPILSCDNLNGQKLKHCDSIYFEKFVEEHASSVEGGKRPTKTLMFIEGCPRRLGCTILLKGAHSDELKSIKCVVRCAVVIAYHLILETSFLVDQKAMFSTVHPVNVAGVLPSSQQSLDSTSVDASIPSIEYSAESGLGNTDVPIFTGLNEKSNNSSIEPDAFLPFSYEPYNSAVISGFSAISPSLKKVLGGSFPFASSAPCQSLSACLGFNGKKLDDQVNASISSLDSLEVDGNIGIEAEKHSNEEKLLIAGQSQSSHVHLDTNSDKDDSNAILDSQSILVLMSSRNALRGTICQQSHFSHIMFYKNFDVPLGKFLKDNLLNQTRFCDTCNELPEAHFYYYAHHNKQLTIQVKRLSEDKCLSGEVEGKLWMWSRCGKCKSSSTKRVLISTTARSLSFGKFLELSLSHYSTPGRKLSCGHSLDRDFLYFFGLGHMVAMFRYSSVTTYNVFMPPQKIDLSGPIKQEMLFKEIENVYMKGMLLFTELANFLKTTRLDLGGSVREFSDVEKMSKQEQEEFEVNIKNGVAKKGNPDRAAYKLLSLNRLMWDLLIESCVWDRRLNSLLTLDRLRTESGISEKVMRENSYSKVEGTTAGEVGSMETVNIDGSTHEKVMQGTSAEVNEIPVKEVSIGGHLEECIEQDFLSNTSDVPQSRKMPIVMDLSSERYSDRRLKLNLDVPAKFPSADGNPQEKDSALSNHLQTHDNFPDSDIKVSKRGASYSPASHLLDLNDWFWQPFAGIRQISVRDFQKRLSPRVELVSSTTIECIPTANQLISEEGTRLHIPLKTDNLIVSDYEDEPSSIIACALAFLKDSSTVTDHNDVDNGNEDDKRENEIASKSLDPLHGLAHGATLTFPHLSSSGSLDSDSVHSTGSISLEQSGTSPPPENHSIEVAMGYAKSLGREKYSVICHCVNQFRELRNQWCLSELDYISSLSRCRNWDAKGGKSKSFFAKTLDDRFIIKEIKKAELVAFLSFSSDYFKYMRESYDTGNQTCLAKILGIYQLTKRNIKSGKEVKHDLLVMENLMYNRNITRQYDLKGALFARFNTAGGGVGDVLLDQNFVNDMNTSPLYVSQKAKHVLQRAVWNDTAFLNSVHVMDYSLLVGVDSQKHELVCGIIDYLRQYTWDKQFERWVKSSLVVPKNVLPTVISPREYKKRIRKFLSTHFLSVPDHWCSPKLSSTSRICASGEGENDPPLQIP